MTFQRSTAEPACEFDYVETPCEAVAGGLVTLKAARSA